MPSRREFLGQSAAALLGAAAAPLFAEDAERGSLQEWAGWFSAFAKNLEQVAGVKIHNLEQAKKILVLLEQDHWHPSFDSERMQRVADCQKELYLIMLALLREPKAEFRSILNESVRKGQEAEEIAERRKQFRSSIETALTPASLPVFRLVPEVQVQRGMRDLRVLDRRYNQTSTLGWIGASDVLGYTHGLTILAAEDPELKRQSDEAEAAGNDAEFERVRLGLHEQKLVEFARERPEEKVYTTLGWGHDLADNVQGTDLALAVVTPNTVARLRREREALLREEAERRRRETRARGSILLRGF